MSLLSSPTTEALHFAECLDFRHISYQVREQKVELEKKLRDVTDEINSTDPLKDGIVSR